MIYDRRPGIATTYTPCRHGLEFANWTYDDDAIRDEGEARCLICRALVAVKFRVRRAA